MKYKTAWTFWIALSLLGYVIMTLVYWYQKHSTDDNPLKCNHVFFAVGKTNKTFAELKCIRIPVTWPLNEDDFMPEKYRAQQLGIVLQYRAFVLPCIFQYDSLRNYLGNYALRSGRLPQQGCDETLAGFDAKPQGSLVFNGKAYTIVGRLKSEYSPVQNCYLLDGDANTFQWYGADYYAYLLRSDFPYQSLSGNYYIPNYVRLNRAIFYFYISGIAILLTGLTGLAFKMFWKFSKTLRHTWLGKPFLEMAKHRKMIIGLHIIFYLLILALLTLPFDFPEASSFMTVMKQNGGLPIQQYLAAQAYTSKNVVVSALAAFVNNFFLVACLSIVIPSLIIPCGGLAILILICQWILAFAPLNELDAGWMLINVFTMFLEFEGYILSGFLSLMITVYLWQRWRGSLWERYKQAFGMSMRGLVIGAGILGIAAMYEAIELIYLSKLFH